MRRISAFICIVFLLGVMAVPGFLLATQAGALWLANQAEERFGLRIEDVRGSIATGFSVRELALETPSLALNARAVRIEVGLRCALRRVLCLDRVDAEDIDLRLPVESPAAAGNDSVGFPAPLAAIRLSALDVARLQVSQGETREEASHLKLQARADADGVNVEGLEVCHRFACVTASASLSREARWGLEASIGLQNATRDALSALDLTLPDTLTLVARGQRGDASVAVSSAADASLRLDVQVRAEEALVATGTVRDLRVLVPSLRTNPWTQFSGTAEVALRADGQTLVIDLAEELAGYAPESLPLALRLARLGGEWRIEEATLGDPSAPRLSVMGTLGTPEELNPHLAVEAQGLDLPGEAGIDVRAVTGRAHLAFRSEAPDRTWEMEIHTLSLVESKRHWQIAGQLEAAGDSLLPVGRADVLLSGPEMTSQALQYQHSREGEAAVLRAPDGLRYGDFALSKAELTIAAAEDLALRLQTAGDLSTELTLRLEQGAEGVTGALDPFTLRVSGATVVSDEAVYLAWNRDDEALELSAFCLMLRRNRACSAPLVVASRGTLDLTLRLDDRYDGHVADKAFSVEGRAEGSATLRWVDWEPRAGEIDVMVRDLALDPYAAEDTAAPMVWDQGRIAAQYETAKGSLDLRLGSSTAGVLSAEIGVENTSLKGRLRARGVDLTAISDLIPELEVHRGSLEANLSLAGTTAAPDLRGEVLIGDARVGLETLETTLEDLNLRADLSGSGAVLRGDARVGEGPLGVEARCCDGDRLSGTLIGSRNRLRLSSGLDASVSPSLDFSVDPRQLSVTGSVSVHDGVFEHSGLADGGVKVSADVVRVDSSKPAVRRFDLSLDLRTLIEPGFVLRSTQIESTLGGDLRFSMAPKAPPTLFGNLDVLGGELRVYGQALRLTDGALGFVGDPLNPDLSISAEREIRADNQRVGFRVSGTLQEPLFELFSDPQRSNDVTLSYLLRGRGPDVGVSADGTAMALSLGASAVNQSGVLGSLNSIPGLSGVTIGAEGTDEDMAATISAYVGNRLYLSYGVGIYEPINALTARLYLRSRLWLEVVSRLESSFDVFYRFDRY